MSISQQFGMPDFTSIGQKVDQPPIAELPFQAFEKSLDSMGAFSFAPLHFAPFAPYDSSSSTPILEPQAQGSSKGPMPYGPTEQKMVKYFFSDQVLAQLQHNSSFTPDQAKTIFNAVMEGNPLPDPVLNSIAANISVLVTKKTIDEGNLPQTWTITSTDAKDWTPLPIQPYGETEQAQIGAYYDQALSDQATAYLEQHIGDLTPEQTQHLITALQTGQISSDIADIYVNVSQNARIETQTAFGLPSTWFKGTANVDDWSPINLGIITPSKVAEAKISDLLDHAEQVLKDIQNATTTLLAGLTANSPIRGALTDFLKIIGEAIRDLKTALRQLQVKDAEKTEQNSKAKFSELADRQIRAGEQMDKMMQMEAKQKSMKGFGLAMKIMGPIISAIVTVVSTIIGIIIAAATLGVGTPAAIAFIAVGAGISLAIGTALTVYSVVDSATNLTQKLVKLFDNTIKAMMPNSPEWAQKLVKAAIIIAAVVLLTAIVIIAAVLAFATGSGESAAVNATTQAVIMAITKAILQGVQQMAAALAAALLMSSNALPELISSILKAAGVGKEGQQAAAILISIATMLAITVAMAALSAASGAAGKQAASAATEGVETASKGIGERLKEAMDSIVQQAKDIMARVKEFLTDSLADKVKTIVDYFKASGLQLLNTIVKTIPMAVQGVASIVNASMNLVVYKLLLDIGELTAAEDLLKSLIEALEKLLKNLQAGMSTRNDFIVQLQQTFGHIYNAANQNYGKLAQALQG
ncbi:type III secretion system translocon subunit SctE [Candidatus Protochlamydia phocaeensis]|uniref:type III secretion system translocon subunit SctE n=1 Tax=Candidatus Protochlamydia phocaeensis TaxID=1414722 RepID=UPI000837CBF4|nr:type III secretion system translocon subunit SctE [Candidatus Protochlamydia phocaeensis]